MTVIDWTDIFIDNRFCQIVTNSLKYCCLEKNLIVYGYCIMTNHIHLLVDTASCTDLASVIRDFKKHTSKKLINQISLANPTRSDWILNRFEASAKNSLKHGKYQLWMTGSHPKEVFTENFALQKLNYIHNNPVKAGLVRSPADWVFSSASNYANHKINALDEVYCLRRGMN